MFDRCLPDGRWRGVVFAWTETCEMPEAWIAEVRATRIRPVLGRCLGRCLDRLSALVWLLFVKVRMA